MIHHMSLLIAYYWIKLHCITSYKSIKEGFTLVLHFYVLPADAFGYPFNASKAKCWIRGILILIRESYHYSFVHDFYWH